MIEGAETLKINMNIDMKEVVNVVETKNKN